MNPETPAPDNHLPEPPCVTRFELARLLSVSLRTVDRLIAGKEIRLHRLRNRSVRFLLSDVEQYLREHYGTGSNEKHPSTRRKSRPNP